MATVTFTYRGRCWHFGDNVAIDGDIMPLHFAIARETDPEVLRDHVMCGLDPDFPKNVSPGDIIVAGRRFAQGNPHIQGLIGIAGLGLGLVVESIPRGSFRNAINCAVPILPACPGVADEAADGDELDVDFRTGTFRNVSRGSEINYPPLDAALLTIIENGGWMPTLRKRLAGVGAGAFENQ